MRKIINIAKIIERKQRMIRLIPNEGIFLRRIEEINLDIDLLYKELKELRDDKQFKY